MELTVATYNILHGAAVGYDWARLAGVIRESNADIVGLQEVDRRTHRADCTDGLSELLHLLGWHYGRFSPVMPYDGGEYGIAFLSRFPSVYPERLTCSPLPHREGEEPRSCMHAVIRLKEGGHAGSLLHLFNTHLAFESPASRAPQIVALRDEISRMPIDEPFVLTGDFNTETYSEMLPLLDGRAALANALEPDRLIDTQFKTFHEPPLAIDNIVYDASAMTLIVGGMRVGIESDHNLFWSRFSLAGN